MTDATTPSQHGPPSLPSSPLPKRIKTDSTSISAAQMAGNAPTPTTTQAAQPQPPPPPQPGAFPQPGPPPTTTLPSVSTMLPNIPPPTTQPAHFLHGTAGVVAAPIPPLLIQKLHENATPPTRGSQFAAGYDLYAAAPITIPSKGKAMVSTGLAIAVPAGTYGRVAPRSGLASKHFIDTGAGVIDADYRGEVKVLLFNFSDVDYDVKQGERVAQLVLERIVTPDVVVVDKLEDSVRGAGGFGSTGYA